MSQPVTLFLDQITHQFAHTRLPAVSNMTLKLLEGEILALLGPSGCGKTTLLRLIAGFEQPQRGTIELAGTMVAGAGVGVAPEQRNVGIVFQDYALFPHLSVAKNIAFGLHQTRRSARRYRPEQIERLVKDAIAQVRLNGLEHRYPHELSGGQQQRVALARALAPQPALLLLDEPLSNLDAQVRLRLRQEVRDILKQTGTTAVFVTHDQEEAFAIADQVAVMRQGHLEQIGTPETVYHEPKSLFVAEFVLHANVLPTQWNGHLWTTELGIISLAPSLASITPEAAVLIIRPEELQLKPDETSTVVICDRQFLGREHRYCLLSPSGLQLHAYREAAYPLPIGTRVRLSTATQNLQVFPIGKVTSN